MKKYIIALVSVIAAIVLTVLLIYENVNVFKGEKIKNPTMYTIECTRMNQKDSHVMALKEGDVLDVEFEFLKGRVDITIGMDGEKPIYKGNKVEAEHFRVIISTPGDYRITIKGKHTAGSFKLFLEEPKEE